jgi:aspartate/methionine/tyrosine aminotransferase
MTRVAATPYLEWAKLHSAASWNLAVSGLPAVSLDELGGLPADAPFTGPNAYGYAPLLERIAVHHRVSPAQVATANGCSMANFLALAALIEPGDEVLVERPTYEPILLAAAHVGASIVRFDRPAVQAFRVDVDDLVARITPRTRLVVLANLHNPSSQRIRDADLVRIGNAAARVGARVLVDEVYLDATFDPARQSAVHLGPAFVITSSLTKVWGLSPLRCGWVIGDEALARRVFRLNDLYGNVQPFLMDWLSARAFDRLDALTARTRAILEPNRRVFAEWLQGRRDLAVTMPEAGTTVCARPTQISAEMLCETLLRDYQVSIVPGRFFELPDHVRIGLCTDRATLVEGLRRLDACLRT